MLAKMALKFPAASPRVKIREIPTGDNWLGRMEGAMTVPEFASREIG